MSNSEALNPLWWKGEPIWITAELQGKTSATIFWPGSEIEIKNKRPTYWLPFNGSMEYEVRVQNFFKFLENEQKPANFFTLYFEHFNFVL